MRWPIFSDQFLCTTLSLMASVALASCASDPMAAPPRETFASYIAQVTHPEVARPFTATGEGFAPDSPLSLRLTLPRQGSEAIVFNVGDFEARVHEVGAAGAGVLEGAAVTYRRAGGTSFWGMHGAGYEEWLLLDAEAVRRDRPVARWQVEGAVLRQAGEAVALVDSAGVTRITVTAPAAYAEDGRTVEARLGVEGDSLTLSVDAEGEELFVDPVWLGGASVPMVTGREGHTATLLADGRLLVSGGDDDFGTSFASAEVFDPATGTFSATAAMAMPRTQHTATRLQDGRVLVTGGTDSPDALTGQTASAEIYAPATGTWSSAPSMSFPRVYHTATLLPDGRVLVVGGFDVSSYLGSAEVYDPVANTWSATGALTNPRGFHTATLLADGKVLVTGGIGYSVMADAEVYDPATNTWSVAANMAYSRYLHAATLLGNGDVLVAGYAGYSEVYSPVANTWTTVGGLKSVMVPTMTLLGNGKVLAVGGVDDIDMCRAGMDVFDPATGMWTASGALGVGRCSHSQTLLGNGKVLVAGGVGGFLGQSAVASAEVLTVDLSMDPGPSYPSGAGRLSYELKTADLNADGHRDLLVVAANYLYTALGNGDGTFQAPTRYTMSGTPNSVAVGDFNGDGKVDAATANSSGNVTVRFGYGTGKLKPAVNYPACGQAFDLVAADLDGNGKLDLAVSSGGAALCVLRNNGNGTFQAPVFSSTANPSSFALGIVAGDFNGDGRVDLATADWTAQALSVFLGNGDGSLQAAVSVAAGHEVGRLAAADLDRDGIQDLVVGDAGSAGLALILGNGDGTFQAPVLQASGNGSGCLTTGDFDADGDVDIATSNFAGSDMTVLLGDGNATFQIADQHGLPSSPRAIVAAPLDGDATQDLVVVTASFGYHVLAGHGDGTFSAPEDHALGVGVDSVASADFNGDGHLDVVLANEGSERPSVLLGGAGGALGAAVNLPACGQGEAEMTTVTTGDFNADGHPDVVALFKGYGAGKAYVFLGNGDGTFQAPLLTSAPSSSGNSMAVGDLDGDGKLDLVVVGSSSSKASVLLGNGNGTFKTAVRYTVSSTPYGVALGDMNGDGKLDVVVASYGGNAVDVLLGNGNGTLLPKATYSAPGQSKAHSVALGDFNGDGKLDVAAANYGSGNTSVFLNIGAGKLGAGVNISTGTNGRAVVAADLNNDGIVDLGVASSSASTAGVLLGVGDGTFHTPINFVVGSGARALSVGDFDGNGRPDLAVASYNTNNVTLLFNTAP